MSRALVLAGRPVDVLLLDLDDTILDYSAGVDESWRAACAAVAGEAGVDQQALVAEVARTRRWFWDDPERHRRERVDMLGAWTKIAARALERLGAPAPAVAARLAEAFAGERWAVMRLFPGALDTLVALRAAGLPLGLVTNGDRGQQRRKIERFDLARFFDVMVIEGEFGTGKPGDHLEWDVAAPMRLGLAGIWVDAAGAGVPAGSAVKPDRTLRALSELLAER
jgi:putative hydrolase of the HAD superfamily